MAKALSHVRHPTMADILLYVTHLRDEGIYASEYTQSLDIPAVGSRVEDGSTVEM